MMSSASFSVALLLPDCFHRSSLNKWVFSMFEVYFFMVLQVLEKLSLLVKSEKHSTPVNQKSSMVLNSSTNSLVNPKKIPGKSSSTQRKSTRRKEMPVD